MDGLGLKRVLINAPLADDDVARLRRQCQVVAIDQGDIADHIQDYVPFEAIIASAVVPLGGPMLDRLSGLEVIGRLGIGVDNVDLQAATERGIVVVHTPDAPTQSTAEHTVALLFALAKGLVFQDRGLRRVGWDVRHQRVGRDLAGLTMGLVGLGRIGRRVVQLLQPLQLRTQAYDPYIDPAAATALGVELVDQLEAMLPQVDALSLHAPLNEQTRKLIGRRAFDLMKPGAWLINTARGGIVDEAALIEALQVGDIAAAALDVFEPEPPSPDNPLLSMHNVVVTPHRAFYTQEGLRRLSQEVVDQILMALKGRRPDHMANPQVWDDALCRKGR